MRTRPGEVSKGRRAVERTVARVLAEARSPADAVPRVLEGIGRALGWSFAAFWSPHPKGTLRCRATWAADAQFDAFAETTRRTVLACGMGPAGTALRLRRSTWVRDMASDPNAPRAPAALEAGLHGALAFPVFAGAEPYGAVEVLNTEVAEPDEDLLDLFDVVGLQLGTFVEQEAARRLLEFHTALLEAQSEASLDGIVVIDADRILYWNELFSRMWRVPDGMLAPKAPATPLLEHMAAQTTSPPSFLDTAHAPTASSTGRRDEVRLVDGRVLDRWTTPIRARGGEEFGRLEAFRDITEQKRIEASLRRSEQWVSFLAGVTKLLSESLDFEGALRRFARLAVPWMADWCAVHVAQPDGSLSAVAVAHAQDQPAARQARLDGPVRLDPWAPLDVAAVVRERQPALYSEVTDDLLRAASSGQEHLRALRELKLCSAVIVPIVCRDRVLGALTLVSTRPDRRYTEADVRRAQELAAHAAYPIDNARLFQHNALIAQSLQRSLLPPDLPDIPGTELAARYVPAGEGLDVGGDFYDVFQTGRRTWGVTLGDVTGKGVEAAAVTSLARHTIRAAAMTTSKPSEILRILNQALLEDPTVERFCTAVYAHVEPRFGRVAVTMCCGGHPRPYVLRSNGTIEEVPCRGTILGFMRDVPLLDVRMELQFGDKLFLYTDGITDVRAPSETRQAVSLPLLLERCRTRGTQASADLVTRSVLEIQDGRPRDDLALIVLGVRAAIFRVGRGQRRPATHG